MKLQYVMLVQLSEARIMKIQSPGDREDDHYSSFFPKDLEELAPKNKIKYIKQKNLINWKKFQ